MTTSKQESLQKIRHQIKLADGYCIDSPYWQGAAEALEELRHREKSIANELQIEALNAELERMNHVTF